MLHFVDILHKFRFGNNEITINDVVSPDDVLDFLPAFVATFYDETGIAEATAEDMEVLEEAMNDPNWGGTWNEEGFVPYHKYSPSYLHTCIEEELEKPSPQLTGDVIRRAATGLNSNFTPTSGFIGNQIRVINGLMLTQNRYAVDRCDDNVPNKYSRCYLESEGMVSDDWSPFVSVDHQEFQAIYFPNGVPTHAINASNLAEVEADFPLNDNDQVHFLEFVDLGYLGFGKSVVTCQLKHLTVSLS